MNKISIYFALILLGISAIITQVVIIRELIVIFTGNELSIGIILSNWLVLEAVGSYLAGRWAVRSQSIYSQYTILQGFLAIILPVIIYLARLIPAGLNLTPGEAIDILTILYVSFLLLIPIGLVNGAQFSIGCVLLSDLERKKASLISRVYAFEAFGSVLGGVIVTYICLQYLNSIQTACALSFLNIFSALFLIQSLQTPLKTHLRLLSYVKSAHIGLLAILILITVSGKIENIHQNSINRQWPDYKIISYKNSIYGNVTLIERSGQLHLLSNGVSIATLPIPDISQIEEVTHFPLLFHPDPKDIFLIGGGTSGVIDELLKYNLNSIDYTELDPLLITTVLTYAPDTMISNLKTPILHTHHVDGRHFLMTTENTYDIIIINLPEPSTLALNRFYTSEFFRLCSSRLNHDGILLFQIPGTSSYMNNPLINLTNSLIASVSESFNQIKIIPYETTLVLACNENYISDTDIETLSARLLNRGIETQLFSDLYLKYKMDSSRRLWFDEQRMNVREPQMNKDLHPAALFYDLLYWNSSLSPLAASVYSWFENFKTIHWLIFITLIIVIFFILKTKGKIHSKAAVIISIFSTGISGIGTTIIFLLVFQSFFGYVYFWIGLIMSAFMIGISLGGLWGSKTILKNKTWYQLFLRIEGLISFYLLILTGLILFIPDLMGKNILYALLPYLVLVLTFICGSLTGAQFAIGNYLYLNNTNHYSKTAGVLYASDLLGAWAGSLVITLIFIPILGTIETLLILFCIKLSSATNFGISKGKH